MTRLRTALAALPLAAVALAGCGSGSHFEYHPRATVPVNISVFINSKRVAVSPSSVTQGPVAITITNQATTAESLQVMQAGGPGSKPVAETGPISPQATDQLTVSLDTGSYTVATASTHVGTRLLPARLQVQGQRPPTSQLQVP